MSGVISDILATTRAAFGIGPKDTRATIDAGLLTAPRTAQVQDKSGVLAYLSDLDYLSFGNEIYAGDQLVYAGGEKVVAGYSAPREVFSQVGDPDVDYVAINIKPVAGGLYELWANNLASPLP